MTRLNPLMRVDDHFVEALKAHRPGIKDGEAESIARDSLVSVGIPRSRARNYPHEFSGGMRQRIMIALAVALRPGVIVADEPTTALDVVVEAQILELLDRLRLEEQLGLILITHNLGIVAETRGPGGGDVRRAASSRRGRWRPSSTEPAHPYTQGLLGVGHQPGHDRAAQHRRRPSRPRRPAEGLPVPAALPVRLRAVRVDRPRARSTSGVDSGPPASSTTRRSARRHRCGRECGRGAAPASARRAGARGRRPHRPLRPRRRAVLALQGAGAGGRRRELRRPTRRGVRARRRVRFREDDAGAGAARPRARRRPGASVGRAPSWSACPSGSCGRCAGGWRWSSRTRTPP